MKTLPFILIAAILCSLAVPAAAANDSCDKSYLLQITLAKAGAAVPAVQVVYGSPPLPDSGTLKGTVLSADGGTLSSFSLPDPRVQFGDVMKVSEDGMNRTKLAGTQSVEDHADLVVMFPYTAEATAFTLHDASGTLLASVDLTKAEDKATWDCTAGWGVATPRASAPVTTTQAAPVDPIIPAIAIGALAVAGGLLKRRQR